MFLYDWHTIFIFIKLDYKDDFLSLTKLKTILIESQLINDRLELICLYIWKHLTLWIF